MIDECYQFQRASSRAFWKRMINCITCCMAAEVRTCTGACPSTRAVVVLVVVEGLCLWRCKGLLGKRGACYGQGG